MPATTRERGALAKSTYNGLAGDYLKAGRLHAKLSQGDLAVLLEELLGFEVDATSISHYENGSHTMPAAILLASSAITRQRLGVHPVNVAELWRRVDEKFRATLARRG